MLLWISGKLQSLSLITMSKTAHVDQLRIFLFFIQLSLAELCVCGLPGHGGVHHTIPHALDHFLPQTIVWEEPGTVRINTHSSPLPLPMSLKHITDWVRCHFSLPNTFLCVPMINGASTSIHHSDLQCRPLGKRSGPGVTETYSKYILLCFVLISRFLPIQLYTVHARIFRGLMTLKCCNPSVIL